MDDKPDGHRHDRGQIFSNPRTLTLLSVVLALIGYYANVWSYAEGGSVHSQVSSPAQSEKNAKAGIIAVAAVFLG